MYIHIYVYNAHTVPIFRVRNVDVATFVFTSRNIFDLTLSNSNIPILHD